METNKVFKVLRQKIVDLVLLPESVLNLTELAEMFKVSLMYRAAKNSQLAQFLEKLLSHYSRFWLYIPREMQPKPFFNETIKIIEALKGRNEAELRMATIAHIRESVEEISSYMCV